MEQSGLNRRKVLSALAAAGSTGAVFGSGTAAIFFDTEETTDHTQATGVIDLAVDWALDDGSESGSSEGRATLPLRFTDDSLEAEADLTVSLSESSNPAYPWLRLGCPAASTLAEDLKVTLSYKDRDTIAKGTLRSVADDLRNGVPLTPSGVVDPGNQRACLQPDEDIELELEAKLPDTYAGQESLSVVMDFQALQCRYNDGTTSPYATRSECPVPPENSTKAISFIAFCADDDPDPELVAVNSRNDDGKPLSVDWETDTDVRAVVVKAGPYLTIYDYSGRTITSGTAMPKDDDATAHISTDDGAYDNGDEAIACTVAERVIEDDDDATFEGTQIKFDYDGD